MSRLIDADALFNWGKYKLSDAVKYGNKDAEQQHFSYSTLMMYEIADEIFEAPTVEPKRGEWKWICDDMRMLYEYTCSACQIQIHIPKFKLWDFCPNCGADMRGEK